MAEALFRARLAGRAAWTPVSAGLFAAPGLPASEGASRALAELGLDLAAHRSRPVTEELVAASDWIVPMTRQHDEWLRTRYPRAAERIRLLDGFQPNAASEDVPDPAGQDIFAYRRIRDRIDAALADWILFLLENPPAAERGRNGGQVS